MGEMSRIMGFSLLNEVTQSVGEIIHNYFPQDMLAVLGCNGVDLLNLCNDAIQNGLLDDLHRFSESDPAAKKDSKYVLSAYKGFKAMIYYRISHAILTWYVYQEADEEIQQYLRYISRKISEEGKVETGIDIHPAAQIGSGCVIDHGIGTRIFGANFYEGQTIVVGETVIIGKNCTILNDVVIGSSNVNEGQKKGRRQPKIGNDVTICAGAKLYGKIEIGDKVWIGPKCIVHQNIPSGTKIIMENQYQISRNMNDENGIECDGLIKEEEGIYILGGKGVDEIELRIIDENYNEIDGYEVAILNRKKDIVRFKVQQIKEIYSKKVMLKIVTRDKQWHYYFSRLLERELLKREA